MKLNELSPSEVFSYFEKICSIPHGSGNTGMIADYCLEFAKLHGLKARKDTSDNVVIFKAGSSGYEDCEPVILQGHLDMVCEKEQDCDIDMSVQSIKACTDGKMVWADGTTLGADDGIVVYDNLACHFCGIADDATVADKGIVCNMYTFHQQVVAANDCLSFGSRTPVDCHVLADGIIIAYLGSSLFSPEFQVLRDSTDYSSGKDCIPVADA